MHFFDFPIGPNWAGVFNFKIIVNYHKSIGSLSNPKTVLQNSRSERGRDDYCNAQRQRHDIPVSCILYIPTIYNVMLCENHNFLEPSSMHDARLIHARPICRRRIEYYVYYIITRFIAMLSPCVNE